MKKFILTLIALCFVFPLKAKASQFTYTNENCEFEITFPSEPYTTLRCNPDNREQCNEYTTFTHVFGLDASVNYYFTCYKAEEGMFDRYSSDVMRAVISGMVSDKRLDKFETGFQQQDFAKQAVLIGEGQAGNSTKLYMAQLWVGKNSVLSVEGEVIGEAHQEADVMFKEILESIRPKQAENSETQNKASDENPDTSAASPK
jgi:hypothetical protein